MNPALAFLAQKSKKQALYGKARKLTVFAVARRLKPVRIKDFLDPGSSIF
jgi:hypothetical protein